MAYIDCFVAAVPKDQREAFLNHARVAAEVFKDCGALRVVDCWAEDVPDGEVTSFPMAVKCGADESVALGWVEWPDKETRNAGFEKLMQDSRMDPATNPMPFDGKRLIFGGFDKISDV
ncbi:MAG: DUF1428 domain-containing protein [Alphaproteobacteria bacterium]|nr:DUF1428 domain-containing protein [Alphaproteobacteria bacterium]